METSQIVFLSLIFFDGTLFSTTSMEDKGYGFRHENGRMSLTMDGKTIMGGIRNGSSYTPFMRVIPPLGNAMEAQKIDARSRKKTRIRSTASLTVSGES